MNDSPPFSSTPMADYCPELQEVFLQNVESDLRVSGPSLVRSVEPDPIRVSSAGQLALSKQPVPVFETTLQGSNSLPTEGPQLMISKTVSDHSYCCT